MDTKTADVAIIGGGAAGLTAAIFAAQTDRSKRVVVLDGAKTLGAKILVSGGGRCNVTHHEVGAADFNGSQPVIRNVLAAFDVAAAVSWFASMGVELVREETGKLFPVADTAKAVVSALLNRCRELGVMLATGCRVVDVIAPASDRPEFQIVHESGTLQAKRIIMATGGKSLPRSGSDGAAWEIARRLGHDVGSPHAALAPLVLEPTMFHAAVSGIATDVELTTVVNNKRIDRRTGSLLWTHFGISGPVVMDASRHWVIASESGQRPQMLCNLLPGETFESVDAWFTGLAASRPKWSVGNAVASRLPDRIATALIASARIDPMITCGQLLRDLRRTLVHLLTALPLPIAHHRGWNYAEVTAGGVPLSEIDYRTMQSRKVPGLYLAGEILNCDGRIGGFNFQWAWATGFLAGRAVAAD